MIIFTLWSDGLFVPYHQYIVHTTNVAYIAFLVTFSQEWESSPFFIDRLHYNPLSCGLMDDGCPRLITFYHKYKAILCYALFFSEVDNSCSDCQHDKDYMW